MDEEKAKLLADLIGGDVWDSGGGICLVLKHRSDGKVVAFSDEVVCVYENDEALQEGKALESVLLV
jgi:hypothetical protein